MTNKLGNTYAYTNSNYDLTGYSKLCTELYLNSLTNYGSGTGYNFDYTMSVFVNEDGNGTFYSMNTGSGNIWKAIGNRSERLQKQDACRDNGEVIGSISNLLLNKRYIVETDISNVNSSQEVYIFSWSPQYVDTQIIWRMYRCWIET